jgi:hypothetical protein
MSTITFTRVKNDVNGNPRYVCHFTALGATYAQACANANKIGGRKYTAKWFGGGIVFTSYSLDELINEMNRFRPVPATKAIIANY